MNATDAAKDFVTANGRLLDRLRLLHLLGEVGPDQVLAALDAYGNPDGSYGWGLEADLRDSSGQPGAALHAFEVFAEVGVPTPRAVRLCDWLGSVALPGGALPFALPVRNPTGVAPFWRDADPTAPSLHITTVVTAGALRVARHDPAVAAHPWLAASRKYCLDTIAAREKPEHTLELLYSLMFLDEVGAPEHTVRLGAAIPETGLMHVEGGRDDEFLRPLDFSPYPGRPSRQLFRPEVIEAELGRLAARQQDDGGWPSAFDSYSPAAALEWRAYLTVGAITILRANQPAP